MIVNLLKKLWADECGAVIAAEYLMLGSIVAAGSATGLVAMRDAMVSEYKEFGNSVHEIRQAHTADIPGLKAKKPPATSQYGEVEYSPVNGVAMVP